VLFVRSSLLAAIVFFAGPACADDLNADQIRQLISGKTVYMETTANSETRAAGAAHQFFAADGSVLFKTAKGELWTGTWSIHNGRPRGADSVCIDWKQIQNNGCYFFDKQGETVSIKAGGVVLAKIGKIADGNVEKLVAP
jgi:hypothetical protein